MKPKIELSTVAIATHSYKHYPALWKQSPSGWTRCTWRQLERPQVSAKLGINRKAVSARSKPGFSLLLLSVGGSSRGRVYNSVMAVFSTKPAIKAAAD